jgi:hypothetical protein
VILFSPASLYPTRQTNGPTIYRAGSTFKRDVRRDIDARRRLLPRLEQGRRGELLLPERSPWAIPTPQPTPVVDIQIDAKDTKDAVYAKVKEAVNKCLADKGQ